MAELMASGSVLVDTWVKHCVDTNATTPELVALMLISLEDGTNKMALMTVLAASAVQRLAGGSS